MKNKNTKKAATLSVSTMMLLSMMGSPIYAIDEDTANQDTNVVEVVEESSEEVVEENQETVEEEATVVAQSGETEQTQQARTAYSEGVTVVADENSPSGYTAHFVYNLTADLANSDGSPRSALLEAIPEDAEITSVNLVGSFRLHSSYEVGDDRGHSLKDYKPGDFAANVHPTTWTGEWTFENLEKDENGNYTISVPMISGAHYYYYQINYQVPGEERTRSVSVDDPKNVSPCRENEANSDSNTGDITHSIVYGKWCEKQGTTPNLDYMTPYEGTNKGKTEYVEYKGTLNNHQDLGVYLPAGYDANREEPYKVIYLSHGAGGNETYWFTQPQATNVMDHMIAENPDQEAIVVGLDNTLYGWNYYQIGQNVTKYVIPYMEEHYNVSKDAKDRAFAGFSMGSMTTTYMAFNHADMFGYFGIFSGTNITNFNYEDGFELDTRKFNTDENYRNEVYEKTVFSDDLLNSVVYTQAGNYDTAVAANGWSPYMAYESIRDVCKLKMPEGNFIDGGFVHGSHDIYTWGQCLYNFAKDIVWSKDVDVTPEEPTTPTNPDQSETNKPSDKGNSQTNTSNSTTDKTSGNTVKTGDNTNIVTYVVTAFASMMTFVGAIFFKKRRHN